MVNLSKSRLLFFCPDPMINQEIDRWTNQEWAVKIETREIFHIEDMEVFGNELVLYAGTNTNSSMNLLTVNEAYTIEEKMREIF